MLRLGVLVVSVLVLAAGITGLSFLSSDRHGMEQATVVTPAPDGTIRVSMAEPQSPLRWATLKWPLAAISVMAVLFVTAVQLRQLVTDPVPAQRAHRKPAARTARSRKLKPQSGKLAEWTSPLPDYGTMTSSAGD